MPANNPSGRKTEYESLLKRGLRVPSDEQANKLSAGAHCRGSEEQGIDVDEGGVGGIHAARGVHRRGRADQEGGGYEHENENDRRRDARDADDMRVVEAPDVGRRRREGGRTDGGRRDRGRRDGCRRRRRDGGRRDRGGRDRRRRDGCRRRGTKRRQRDDGTEGGGTAARLPTGRDGWRKEEGGRRKGTSHATAQQERRGLDCGVLRVGQRRRAREECERGTRKAQG